MRDRSRGHTVLPELNLVAYSSLAVIGVATVLSGIVISGVTLYRSITAGKPESFKPEGPQIADTIKLENSILTCFQPSDTASTLSETSAGIVQPQELSKLDSTELKNKIASFGNHVLIEEESTILQSANNSTKNVEAFTKAKQKGVEEYTNGQYQAAINMFQTARDVHKNSPETLIYLNNSLASQADRVYELAVTVPLQRGHKGPDFDAAMAVLRGVAHAQDDINKAGGIQGVPLKLLIVDDFENSPQSADTIAQMLVKQQGILGVVGHDASKATLAARRVYEKNGLTSISPASTSADLPPGHSFAFRTVPNDIVAVKKMAAYLRNQNRSQIAVFYTEDNEKEATGYSQPVKEQFEAFINNNIPNGKVVKEFNLADLDNDYNSLIGSLEQLIKTGAIDTILLVPSHSDASISKALEVAAWSRSLSKSILIIGNDAMYDSRVAKCGDQASNMVAVSFWDMNFARTSISSVPLSFAHRESNPEQDDALWDTNIHWRSAMAYDALLTFGKALDETHPSPTRKSIAASLSASRFSVDGATGIVKFDSKGDRIGTAKLVKLLPTNSADNTESQYDFQPIFSE